MKRHFFKTLFAISVLGLSCESVSADNRWEGSAQTSLESSRFDGGNRITSTLGLELLYWEASQSNLDYLITAPGVGTNTFFIVDGDTQYIDHGYSLGYRLPYTFHTMKDGLDIHFDVTVFSDTERTMFAGSTGSHHPTFLHPELFERQGLNDSGAEIDEVSARNKITYSTYDFLASRSTYATSNFEFTPFWGVRILNLTQSLHASYTEDNDDVHESHDNGKVLAAGIYAGLQNKFYLMDGFSLKGKVAGSLVAGDIKNERMVMSESDLVIDVTDKRHAVLPCFELSFGFNWETFMRDKGDYLNIHLSYEMVQWFNTPSARRFYGEHTGVSGGERDGKLGFNGFSLGATYQF